MVQGTNGSTSNSKTKIQRRRLLRKLAQTNQALQGLGDTEELEDQRNQLARHRQTYAERLGMTLDEASQVSPN